jgi:hypothetical protein
VIGSQVPGHGARRAALRPLDARDLVEHLGELPGDARAPGRARPRHRAREPGTGSKRRPSSSTWATSRAASIPPSTGRALDHGAQLDVQGHGRSMPAEQRQGTRPSSGSMPSRAPRPRPRSMTSYGPGRVRSARVLRLLRACPNGPRRAPGLHPASEPRPRPRHLRHGAPAPRARPWATSSTWAAPARSARPAQP